jgi:hypothetical protein
MVPALSARMVTALLEAGAVEMRTISNRWLSHELALKDKHDAGA